jgi:hypothetical protein
MPVYAKLMEARIKLHGQEIKKSGRNTFANYSYMELADFLIPTQTIFAGLGLCGIVSFTADLASLTIIDTEDGTQHTITSPMGSAALKGCHEVQNIGAVETYQRRYLWMAALEIVEHDALDSSPPKGAGDDPIAQPKNLGLTPARAKIIRAVAAEALQKFNEGDEWGAYESASALTDTDEMQALWGVLKPHSALRSCIKRLAKAEREGQKQIEQQTEEA